MKKTRNRAVLALLLALLGSFALADPFGGTAPKPEPDRIVIPR
ncbi:hypothetical protein [Deinococcus aquaticus]